MPLSEIALALVRRGVVTRAAAIEAEHRKKLYGGGLDTALLELRASDEDTLIGQLAEILGIPLAPPQILKAVPDPAARVWLDAVTAQRLGAAPRAKQADVLSVLVRPEHDHDAMVKWAAERALLVEPALVCEARFRAHAAAIYDLALPPRYLALLAKLVGTSAARTLTGGRGRSDFRTPTPVAPGVDAVETLLAAARLGEAAERRSALRRLSRRLQDSRVIAFRHALEKKAGGSDMTAACGALRALAELRDKNAVPAVAELLETGAPEVAKAAHAALVQLTASSASLVRRRASASITPVISRSSTFLARSRDSPS
jgi:hypothetical protein